MTKDWAPLQDHYYSLLAATYAPEKEGDQRKRTQAVNGISRGLGACEHGPGRSSLGSPQPLGPSSEWRGFLWGPRWTPASQCHPQASALEARPGQAKGCGAGVQGEVLTWVPSLPLEACPPRSARCSCSPVFPIRCLAHILGHRRGQGHSQRTEQQPPLGIHDATVETRQRLGRLDITQSCAPSSHT